MKILFVDDEKIIRDGMKELVDWDKVKCTKLVMAKNATEALEIIESEPIDLVITDIYMQKMSGIELAKCIRRTKPHIKVIILSAYENFNYAREAIEANVLKYILKPIVPSELEDAILEATRQIDSQIRLQNQMLESEKLAGMYQPILAKDFWKLLLRGEIQDEIDISHRIQLASIILPKDKLGCIVFAAIDKNIRITDDDIVNIHIQSRSIFAYVKMDRHTIAFLYSRKLSQEELVYMRVEVERVIQSAVIFVQMDYVNKITDLRDSYLQGEQIIDFYRLVSAADHTADVENSNEILNDENIRGGKEKIIECMQYGTKTDEKCINEYFKQLERYNLQEQQHNIVVGRLLFEMLQIQKKYKKITENDFLGIYQNYIRCDSIQKRKLFVVDFAQQVIENRNDKFINSTTQLIIDAKKIMNECFQDGQLSINSIANTLHVSTSYLSRIFKKKTGMTCVEYITDKRIEKAKWLLINTDIKQHQIAQEIGYSNVYYFSIHFKKVTGETPGQYRKRMEDEDEDAQDDQRKNNY